MCACYISVYVFENIIDNNYYLVTVGYAKWIYVGLSETFSYPLLWHCVGDELVNSFLNNNIHLQQCACLEYSVRLPL